MTAHSITTALFCGDCGRPWNDTAEPRWRACLTGDGSGTALFYCTECMDARQRRSQPLYAIQLHFSDGRWTIDELRLPERPREGDVLRLAGGVWQVCGSRHVPVQPAGKPPREYIVCQQFAA